MIGPPPEKPGPYQERDWHVVDYQYGSLPGVPFQWRGPLPDDLGEGAYFSTLGAAQTLGRFCARPFPSQVAETLDLPVLNFGYSGAGAGFFLGRPAILEIVNRSRFAVVQVMSGRSEGNSLMACESGRNRVTWLPTGETCFSEKAFRYLIADHDLGTVRRIVAETRANWVRHMTELLDAIDVPTVLLWIAGRGPRYRARYLPGLYNIFGSFPHLVNEKMMRQVRPHADAAVEVVSKQGVPHRLVHRATGEPTMVRFPDGRERGEDRSYPSPEMHDDAAIALVPAIHTLLSPSA